MKKINMAKAKHQGYRTRICPECNYHFDDDYKDVIGYDINLNGRHVLIFECPRCFEKSYLHCDKDFIDSVDRLIESNIEFKDIIV